MPRFLNLRPMHAIRMIGLCLALFWPGLAAQAASANIYKVLPQFVDREGRHLLSPSLYERDAYQALLRQKPELRSGLRFAVLWKARGASQLTLRVEMRGSHENRSTTAVIESNEIPRRWFRQWSAVTFTGEEYKAFGDLLAWRVTLWDKDTLVAEHKSFLW